MKIILPFLFVLFLCSPSAAQDLPPDMLADQYLLEATEALEQGDPQKALRAFKKIKALEVEPPPLFAYFYGKLLAEYGSGVEALRKGQALLKQFVISAGRDSDYYTPTLKLLSMVEAKLEAAEQAAQAAERAAQREAKLRAHLLEILPNVLPEVNAQMVRVESGTFTMGLTPEQNCRNVAGFNYTRWVEVSSFELSKYEVTQEVWAVMMGENPSRHKNCPPCPVEQVSWEEVQEFLRRLNMGGGRYRLPSEVEWEYAARGGQRSRGHAHAGSDDLNTVAWHSENSGDTTHPVGQKQANELGLYDLTGNVLEWVQDYWHYEGKVYKDYRVVRGSSFNDHPYHHCSAYRTSRTPDYRYDDGGFRLARSLP